MISSNSEEELFIKWLFGEIINYKHGGLPVRNSRAWGWATQTRFHKIIFNILEEHAIPVTRSWYMWGGYVHTDLLEQEKFDYYRRRYSTRPEVLLELREEIRKKDFPIDDILESMIDISKVVLSMSSKEFIPKYYQHYTPLIYRDIYVSKQNLTDYFDIFSGLAPYRNHRTFLNIQKEFQTSLNLFNASGYKLLDDETLIMTNYKFNSIIGAVLDKFNVKLFLREEISPHKSSFINTVNEFFKEYIWKPYASRVSQITVKGLRAASERRTMMEREFNSIEFGKDEIDKLSLLMHRYDLEPTFQEYKIIETNDEIDPKIKSFVDEMLKIYTKR